MLLVLSLGAIGCKSSTPPGDGGSQTDRPPGDSGGMVCTGSGTGSKTNGEPCACGTECGSGFCVDGVCCGTACNGTCQSCGLATSLGMCTSIPAGVKPREATQCSAEDKGTCGRDGTCDGAGKCRTYESGTVCKAGTCETDAVTGTFTCDGAGKCRQGAATVCAPFSCNRVTNLCFAACGSDADCVAGRKCVNGSCGPKMAGATCKQDGECASSFCVRPGLNNNPDEGVCCNTACAGACRVCNQPDKLGTCSPVPAGQGHALCSMQTATTCGTTGVCDGFGTCLLYPTNSPCGAASCATATSVNSARTCDGLGTCQPPDMRDCGNYRCTNGACSTRCTTVADCAPGIACVNNSCGKRVDGQPCAGAGVGDADCQNGHCVVDVAGGAGVCCNTTCTGPCKSCALTGMEGRCTNVAAGAADPRQTCVDMTAAMCATDGRCDGAGACRRYPSGTMCSGETCVSDVYTAPSTCNASGQCVKPTAAPCAPYHCNASKCFTACSATGVECIPPNICGMNGMISSCGLKPPGASCSVGTECTTSVCAQGVCCNNACNLPCQACNLASSRGTCTNVASGPDPQGMCATQAVTTCGTTGQCAAGQCARYASGIQCAVASCPTASTRTPPAACNGTGMCITPTNANCAPGRCDTATLTCLNTCTSNAQCTAPAICVNGSCGLQAAGGSCTATNQCMTGLTCYLDEGTPGVCCTSACNGTCETCRNSTGTCTPIAAGAADPDPLTLCKAATDPMTCGLNGRCAGNNTATNGPGTARCQFYGAAQGCGSRSCTPGTPSASPAMETAARTCNGAGACSAAVTSSCGLYTKCDVPPNQFQCATTCASNADCVGATCNTVKSKCGGTKQARGETCNMTTDCDTGLSCADGVCCNTACAGACEACNNVGSIGTCSSVPVNTAEPMCSTTPNMAMPCQTNTGLCGTGGTCAKVSGTTCAAAACADGFSRSPASTCNGMGTCVTPAATSCAPGHCAAGACSNSCTTATQAADCMAPNTCVAGTCGLQPPGGPCITTGQCSGASAACVNGVCCLTASCPGQSCSADGMTLTAASTCGAGGSCTAPPPATCAGCQTCAGNTACHNRDPGTAPVPTSTCNPVPPCGNTGMCNGSGACAVETSTATVCGTGMTCSGAGMLKQPDHCSGTGTCTTGATGSCPGGFTCLDTTSCKTSCTDPAMDCADPLVPLCVSSASCI